MKMIDIIQTRIQEIQAEVLTIVENQTMNLTEKNALMQPLSEEKKVLQHTLVYLEKIKNTNYRGLCSGG